MAPSFYIDLNERERSQLLRIARQSIHCGLLENKALDIDADKLAPALRQQLGVFVTLSINGKLRGCIGAMESDQPLARAVADAAFGAAFRDHRFPPLEDHELENTLIELSLLSPLQEFSVSSREQLLHTLVPEEDGLLLQDGAHRSTFLPKVWEQLPEPELFVAQLLRKAGLAADHWSSTLRLFRYHTASFSEPEPGS